MVLVWNEETLESIRKLPPAPTVAARALAVVHTAIYDAWAAYDSLAVGTRLGAGLRQPGAERTQANKDKAVSFAAYTALMDLFPARQAVFAQRMADLGYATDGSDLSAGPAWRVDDPLQAGDAAAQVAGDGRQGDADHQSIEGDDEEAEQGHGQGRARTGALSRWGGGALEGLPVGHGAVAVGTSSRLMVRSKTRPGWILPSSTSGSSSSM